jgi:hypothetical protein
MKNTITIPEILYAPWTLHFDRDGTEDIAVLCDAEGEELVSSRPFWWPEGNDPMPPILAAMQLMKSAPELLDILESLISESLINQVRSLRSESTIINEDFMRCEAFGRAVEIIARLKTPPRNELDAKAQAIRSLRQIAAVWSIEDVQEIRPDLDDDQAREVLRTIERRHDSNYGISWDLLEYFADRLYPQPDDE